MKLTIIGAGPGGYETAVAAARKGIETTIISYGPVGGTCLNEGCIPAKTFCRNAEVIETLSKSTVFGVENLSYDFDFSKVVARKNAVIEQLRGGVEGLLKGKNLTLLRGKASLKDAHTVVVSSEDPEVDGREIESDWIIIATGSRSATLPIPGNELEGVITSREILDIESVPKRLCVIGAGVIGLEFASIFRSFGSEVTVVEYCKDILPRFDTDLAKRLKQSLGKRGIAIETDAQVQSISRPEIGDGPESNAAPEIGRSSQAEIDGGHPSQGGGLVVTYTKKGNEYRVEADKVLMAVGRRPDLATINLSDVGIEFTPRGIVVDQDMRTSVPNIFAIGDITGGMMLAHAATFQGKVALQAICAEACAGAEAGQVAETEACAGAGQVAGAESCTCAETCAGAEACAGAGVGAEDGHKIDLSIMPAAVFTYPEAATVGRTEEQCKEEGIAIKCKKSFFRANGKALSMDESEGFCKIIIADGAEGYASGQILGCHLFGAHAADIVQEIAALMNKQATINDLASIVHAHPTLGEVILNAAEA